jgi:Subtilase family
MRFRFLCVFLGLAIGWTAAGAPAGASSSQKGGGKYNLTSPPYTVQRVVALQKGTGACPKVNGWQEESLPDMVNRRANRHSQDCDKFGKPSTALEENERNKRSIHLAKLLHKHDLDRFCIYTAPGSTPKFPEPKSVGLEKADPDRMALTPTASADLGAIGDQTWPKLADRFLEQAGSIGLATAKSPSIRLVFVDTQRTGEGPPEPPVSTTTEPYPSWHGHAMANLGNEIVCGPGSEAQNCAVHVATRLALHYDQYDPNMSFSPDPGSEQGGSVGLVGDLGSAILEELALWQDSYHDSKLILNLSVGWDGEHNDLNATSVANLETSAQAVYKALDAAADLDVLVIASAGNRTGGEDSTSALLPAAWELHPPSWLPFLVRKTVYAVGGVDWQGLPLPNSRPGGKPYRVAYGDHAVAMTSEGSTKVYTGTSVSATVVSSIAAVAWYLQPSLHSAQIMALMDKAGEALPTQADFYTWTPLSLVTGPPHLKRLSLCPTVLSLCGTDESLCSSKLTTRDCHISNHLPANLSTLQPRDATMVPFQLLDPSPSCANVFMGSQGSTISDIAGCPMEKLPDMTTPYLVAAQPHENPCPTCTIVPDPPYAASLVALALAPNLLGSEGSNTEPGYGIAVGLDPEWVAQGLQDGTKIESAILVVDCPTVPFTNERLDITSVIQPLYTSSATDPVRISFGKIGARESLAGCTASVDFTLSVTDVNGTSERSVQSPVYVDP